MTPRARVASIALFLVVDRPWPDHSLDDPRFADIKVRRENADACVAELDAEFAKRTFVEWKELLHQLDAPWAPVQSVPELLDDPQVEANGYIGDVVIDGQAAYRLPAVPVQFDGQAPPLRRAPEHGEDGETVLAELGYDWDEISGLKEAGVIL